MIGDLLSGESGWIVGFLMGLAVGVLLCRWLWINGAMNARRRRYDQDDGKG